MDFIQAVLQKLGFLTTWINWIMQCVSTVSYSFLLNGTIKGDIIPKEGSDRDIHCHPTFSFFAVKCYLDYAIELKKKET